MGASTQTANIGLPQFADNDKPTWRGDVNGAFSAIDAKFGNVDGNTTLNASGIADVNERIPVSVKKYNVKPSNTADQNYTNFHNMIAAGETNIVFPPGDYPWKQPTGSYGNFMGVFVNKTKIRITGVGARIIDTSAYSNNGPIEGLFQFNGCTDVKVLGLEYVGPALPTPAVASSGGRGGIGYEGATLVHVINATKGVEVDMRATNARYGVLTGSYSDATQGQCSDFYIKLLGSMIGYGIAAYYANNIEFNTNVDGVHRAVYLAGVDTAKGTARWRDQYIAPIALLLTDCLVSGTDTAAQADPVGAATVSRGCRNIDVKSIDKGSTVFQTTTTCAGISLSRVDPSIRYENITVEVYTKGDNTTSTKVGGFSITSSGISAIWSRYTKAWDPGIIIDGITVRGIVDHSAVTNGDTGNSTGEFYFNTWDDVSGPTYYATVGRVNLDGITYKKNPASTRTFFVGIREPSVPIRINQLNAPGATVVINCSATQPTIIENSTFDTLSLQGAIASLVQFGSGNTIKTLAGSTRYRGNSRGIGSAGPAIMQAELSPTLSGANYTWGSAIPPGAVVLGVQSYVQTAITGATGYQIGVIGDLARYANKAGGTAVGTTSGTADTAATEVGPRTYTANTSLVVTALGGNFTAGKIRLVITYIDFTALTS